MEEFKKRKTIRLRDVDYSRPGTYFLTICTQNRRCLLSRIVGTGVLDGPKSVELLPYGKIADKYINQMNDFYSDIIVERYVIMPNHIHILLLVDEAENGPSGTPVPTGQNSACLALYLRLSVFATGNMVKIFGSIALTTTSFAIVKITMST